MHIFFQILILFQIILSSFISLYALGIESSVKSGIVLSYMDKTSLIKEEYQAYTKNPRQNKILFTKQKQKVQFFYKGYKLGAFIMKQGKPVRFIDKIQGPGLTSLESMNHYSNKTYYVEIKDNEIFIRQYGLDAGGLFSLPFFLFGKKYFKEGKYEKAIKYFKKAINIEKSRWGLGGITANFFYFYAKLGDAYFKAGKKKEALDAYINALKYKDVKYVKNKRIIEVYEQRSDIYKEQGRSGKAIKDLDCAKKIKSNNNEYSKEINNLHETYFYSDSIDYFEQYNILSLIEDNVDQDWFNESIKDKFFVFLESEYTRYANDYMVRDFIDEELSGKWFDATMKDDFFDFLKKVCVEYKKESKEKENIDNEWFDESIKDKFFDFLKNACDKYKKDFEKAKKAKEKTIDDEWFDVYIRDKLFEFLKGKGYTYINQGVIKNVFPFDAEGELTGDALKSANHRLKIWCSVILLIMNNELLPYNLKYTNQELKEELKRIREDARFIYIKDGQIYDNANSALEFGMAYCKDKTLYRMFATIAHELMHERLDTLGLQYRKKMLLEKMVHEGISDLMGYAIFDLLARRTGDRTWINCLKNVFDVRKSSVAKSNAWVCMEDFLKVKGFSKEMLDELCVQKSIKKLDEKENKYYLVLKSDFNGRLGFPKQDPDNDSDDDDPVDEVKYILYDILNNTNEHHIKIRALIYKSYYLEDNIHKNFSVKALRTAVEIIGKSPKITSESFKDLVGSIISNCKGNYVKKKKLLIEKEYEQDISRHSIRPSEPNKKRYNSKKIPFNAKDVISDYDNKIKQYTEKIKYNPENYDLYNERGKVYFARGNYLVDILKKYLNTVKLGPAEFAYYFNIYDFNKDYDKAVRDYSSVIWKLSYNDKSDGQKYYINRAKTYEAKRFYKKKFTDDCDSYYKAMEDYTKLIKLNPKKDIFYVNRARLYFEKAYNYKDKINLDCTKAIELYTKNSIAYSIRAEYFYNKIYNDIVFYKKRNIHFKKIITDYKTAIKMEPDKTCNYFLLGECYYNKDNYTEAEYYYKKAIKLDVDNYKYYNDLGYVYLNIKKYGEAIKYFRSSIKLGSYSNNSSSYRGIGDAYFNKKDYDEAIKYYKRSMIRKSTGLKDGVLSDPINYKNLAKSYFAKKDYGKAIKNSINAVTAGGNKEINYSRCAESYSAKGDYSNAADYYGKAIKNDAKNPEYYYLRGNAYFNLAKETLVKYHLEDAISDYEEAIEKKPNYKKAKDALKKCHSFKRKIWFKKFKKKSNEKHTRYYDNSGDSDDQEETMTRFDDIDFGFQFAFPNAIYNNKVRKVFHGKKYTIKVKNGKISYKKQNNKVPIEVGNFLKLYKILRKLKLLFYETGFEFLITDKTKALVDIKKNNEEIVLIRVNRNLLTKQNYVKCLPRLIREIIKLNLRLQKDLILIKQINDMTKQNLFDKIILPKNIKRINELYADKQLYCKFESLLALLSYEKFEQHFIEISTEFNMDINWNGYWNSIEYLYHQIDLLDFDNEALREDLGLEYQENNLYKFEKKLCKDLILGGSKYVIKQFLNNIAELDDIIEFA